MTALRLALLEASPAFADYPPTAAGVISWLSKYLPTTVTVGEEEVRLKCPDGILLMTPLTFLQIVLLPLYHTEWENDEDSEIVRAVHRQEWTAVVRKYYTTLRLGLLANLTAGLGPSKPTDRYRTALGLHIDDITEEWVDLLKDYVKKGLIDMSKYNTVKDLELRVDQLEGLAGPTDEPPCDSVALSEEKKSVLAATLRLAPESFRTASEAMALYGERD